MLTAQYRVNQTKSTYTSKSSLVYILKKYHGLNKQNDFIYPQDATKENINGNMNLMKMEMA